MKPLRILFLASEADPFVKVGGLGDVAGSLPYALQSLGQDLDVRLVIPFHPTIRAEGLTLVRETVFTIPHYGREVPAQVFCTDVKGLPVYLISGAPVTGSLKVYDPNPKADGEKYVFFSMAALEMARRLDWRPDIVHANDWHTAPAVYGVRLMQEDPFWKGVKTVFSVHNLGYMGAEAESALLAYGLPPIEEPLLPEWARRQPMGQALWAADTIVAVSPSYAEEIQTPEYGYGLETYLQAHREKITGIVNGIDYALWNPTKDSALEANFDSTRLEERARNKSNLQAQFGLTELPEAPLLAMVTRFDFQKGVDIALNALRMVTAQPWQAILLGTGNAALEEAARLLEAHFPNRVAAVIRFDARLSRQIYGGADILLMPSRYEPCGLAQMIAMRYGAIPLARATGGLRDTIADGRTGFLFTEPSPSVMAASIRRAVHAYRNRETWQAMQRAAMAEDFSWEKSARQYVDLYRTLQRDA
ncbi:MAG: glycogen synthase [Anaerolineales bacterium]|nr:glycogen synthase [Anaerolineales bacterium]